MHLDLFHHHCYERPYVLWWQRIIYYIIKLYYIIPYWAHGMRQREQWEMSKALEGKGSLLEARTPINAGTPRSRANWTCASWVSLGAIDNVRMSRDRRYAPQLATSTITKVSERKKKMLKLGHYITLHSALIIKLKSISETQFPLSFIFLKRQKKILI